MRSVIFIGLIVILFVKTGYGQTKSETTINEFLHWKLNPKQSTENNVAQENLPIESISYKVIPVDVLSSQTIKLYKIDKLLTKADIITMNQQIKYWNNTKKWDSKKYKFPFINPDTLTDSATPFLELSIPIFSKNKQICLFRSNISCHQNYCHDEMIAIYQKKNIGDWKIIKVIHHVTF